MLNPSTSSLSLPHYLIHPHYLIQSSLKPPLPMSLKLKVVLDEDLRGPVQVLYSSSTGTTPLVELIQRSSAPDLMQFLENDVGMKNMHARRFLFKFGRMIPKFGEGAGHMLFLMLGYYIGTSMKYTGAGAGLLLEKEAKVKNIVKNILSNSRGGEDLEGNIKNFLVYVNRHTSWLT